MQRSIYSYSKSFSK